MRSSSLTRLASSRALSGSTGGCRGGFAGACRCTFVCADGGWGFGADVAAGGAADAPVDEGVDEAEEGLVLTAAAGAAGAEVGGSEDGVPMCRCLGVPAVGAEVGGRAWGADSAFDGEAVGARWRAAA